MRQSTAICREVEKALAPFVDGLNITVSIGVHFEMPRLMPLPMILSIWRIMLCTRQKGGQKPCPSPKPAFRTIIIIISELLNITVTDSHQLTAICYFFIFDI